MARTPKMTEDRREQIINAALRVFAQKGFARATNSEIAREAGNMTPGLIYYYFKRKEDLRKRGSPGAFTAVGLDADTSRDEVLGEDSPERSKLLQAHHSERIAFIFPLPVPYRSTTICILCYSRDANTAIKIKLDR